MEASQCSALEGDLWAVVWSCVNPVPPDRCRSLIIGPKPHCRLPLRADTLWTCDSGPLFVPSGGRRGSQLGEWVELSPEKESHVVSPGITSSPWCESDNSSSKAQRWQSLGIWCPQRNHKASGGQRGIYFPAFFSRKFRLYTLCSYLIIRPHVTSGLAALGGN